MLDHTPIFGPDWTSHHYNDWTRWLGHLAGQPCLGLEVGSFEGRSALWFMENICTARTSRLLCIDPHDYADEKSVIAGGGTHIEHQFDWSEIKRRFEHNLSPWLNSSPQRLWLKSEPSRHALCEIEPLSQFDFAYLDGSHIAACVMEDAVLAWPRLKPGGIMIFDDYRWAQNKPPPAGYPAEVMRPQIAIDCWLRVYAGQYDQLDESNDQVKVRKL
jgi:hypothetical protein